MICDGFVGNVLLKLMEGFGEDIMKFTFQKIAENLPDQLDKFKAAVKGVSSMYDFNQYGGAPLLGVNGIWIICHGASSYLGIKNAIRTAKVFSSNDVNKLITEKLSEDE